MFSARTLEHNLGAVLRAGTIVSSICLGAGLLLWLAGMAGAVAAVLLQAGVVVLLATPVARVLVSIAGYVAERDWRFATLTTIVLLELFASIVAAYYGRKV